MLQSQTKKTINRSDGDDNFIYTADFIKSLEYFW